MRSLRERERHLEDLRIQRAAITKEALSKQVGRPVTEADNCRAKQITMENRLQRKGKTDGNNCNECV